MVEYCKYIIIGSPAGEQFGSRMEARAPAEWEILFGRVLCKLARILKC